MSNNINEKMHLFSWVKKGIGCKITEVDQLGDGGVEKFRPSVKLTMRLKSTAVQPVDEKSDYTSIEVKNFPVLGPGDVLSINSNAVMSFFPPSGNKGFSKKYRPYIEFNEPDFAWRYTPARATDDNVKEKGKLRPWLAVIACENSKYTIAKNNNGVDLVTFKINEQADYDKIFPDPKNIWKSAHAQADAEYGSDTGFCRIVCVNEEDFTENIEYTAFVIPVFELTRLRALGFDDENEKFKETLVQASAWESYDRQKSKESPFTFPVFFKWNFKAGGETFKDLVKALVPFSTKKSGIDVDVSNLGDGLSYSFLEKKPKRKSIVMPAATLTLKSKQESAFPSANGDEKELFEKLKEKLDLSPVFQENKKLIIGSSYKEKYDSNGNGDPWVVPPIYGGKHAMATGFNDEKLPWLDQVNLDLHYRSVAGLGKKIVQEHQEQFVNRAWKQVELVKELNYRIYKQLLSNNVGTSLKNRYYRNLFKSNIADGQGDKDSRNEFIKNLMMNLQSMFTTQTSSEYGSTSIKSILERRNIPTSFATTTFQNKTQKVASKVGELDISSLMKNIADGNVFKIAGAGDFEYYPSKEFDICNIYKVLLSKILVQRFPVLSDGNSSPAWNIIDYLFIEKNHSQFIENPEFDFGMSVLNALVASDDIDIKNLPGGIVGIILAIISAMGKAVQMEIKGYYRFKKRYNDFAAYWEINTSLTDNRCYDPWRMIVKSRFDFFAELVHGRCGFSFSISSVSELFDHVLLALEVWMKYPKLFEKWKQNPDLFKVWEKLPKLCKLWQSVDNTLFFSFWQTSSINFSWWGISQDELNPYTEILELWKEYPDFFDKWKKNIYIYRYFSGWKYLNGSEYKQFFEQTCSYGSVCANSATSISYGNVIGLCRDIYNDIFGSSEHFITQIESGDESIYFVNRDELVNKWGKLKNYVTLGYRFKDEFLSYDYVQGKIGDDLKETFNESFLNIPDIINIHQNALSDSAFAKFIDKIPGVLGWANRVYDKHKDDDFVKACEKYNALIQKLIEKYPAEDENNESISVSNADLTKWLEYAELECQKSLSEKKEVINRYFDVFTNDETLKQKFVNDCLNSKYPIMAYPQFPEPTYFYLKQVSDKFILPCVDDLKDNSVLMFYSNSAFVDALLCGMNTEMGRELMWREYPTDQRGSYFKKFWDKDSSVQDILDDKFFDVSSLHTWQKKLGKNYNPYKNSQLLMFAIKGKLMKNYPDTQIYLNKAKIGKNKAGVCEFQLMDGTEKDVIIRPSAQAFFRDDIYVVGFDISIPEAIGKPSDNPLSNSNCGYMLVFKQMMENLNFQYYGISNTECKNSIQYAYDYSEENPKIGGETQAIVQPYISAKHVITYVEAPDEE
ncbi:MAG: hypothetical protein J6W51_10780 [Fibrobacter sp.]|nr:hypothetical protein [Fibrobacter sp.]